MANNDEYIFRINMGYNDGKFRAEQHHWCDHMLAHYRHFDDENSDDDYNKIIGYKLNGKGNLKPDYKLCPICGAKKPSYSARSTVWMTTDQYTFIDLFLRERYESFFDVKKQQIDNSDLVFFALKEIAFMQKEGHTKMLVNPKNDFPEYELA